MFYKTCLMLTLAIVTLSLIGAMANASSLTVRQQNFVDARAQSRMRSVYVMPNPFYTRGIYTGGNGGSDGSSSSNSGNSSSGGSGSSRSNYDGYRGGGPGSGK